MAGRTGKSWLAASVTCLVVAAGAGVLLFGGLAARSVDGDMAAAGRPAPGPHVLPKSRNSLATSDESATHPSAASSSASGHSAAPVITYTGWDVDTERIEASAYVSGIIETTGRCELIVRMGGQEESVSTAAVPDAQSTDCGSLSLDASGLASGTWSARVRYDSATSAGESATVPVEVRR